MAATTQGVFDAAVHPRMLSARQIYDYLQPPYDQLVYNSPNRFFHPTPTGIAPYGEWLESSRPSGEVVTTDKGEHAAFEPGSLQERATEHLTADGVRTAVLVPMMRGLQPAADQGNAICSAYNDWQAQTWLADESSGVRYRGTIRVNPQDPEGAVKEIERWLDDPRMVQIGVPLEAHRPYGQRNYLPIWKAAEEHGLPVAIKAEGGVGVDLPVTPLGLPRLHIEHSTLHADRYFPHLASFIAEGVFERCPDLKLLFVDGGFDMLAPAIWRMDMDWPISRREIPWVKQLPNEYVPQHVRFVVDRLAGPPSDDPDLVVEWASRTQASTMLVYGSGYPTFSTVSPDDVLPALADGDRDKILRGNAEELYRGRMAPVAT